MGQRNMRFVLEEGNALTFHDKDGNCIGKQKGLVPEGHSLLLSSEDLSYITYGPSGFHYKRYNPNTMAIDRNTYDIPTEFSASQYEDRIAMAAYCPRSKKAFFITISKKTREIQVWEDDDPNAKTVEQTLPLWRTLRTDNSKSATINLNKDVSLESSYVGEGNINYTAFFSGKDSHGYWQFAIDIPKQNTAPQLVRLDVWGATVSRLTISQTSYFGTGVDPSTITQGQGGYVRICTPVDGIGRGSWDSSDPYDKYMRTGIKDLIHIFSILIIGQFIVLFLIYVAAYPDQFNLYFYFE